MNNKLRHISIMALAAATLSGCRGDGNASGEPKMPDDAMVFFNIDIRIPTEPGTRADGNTDNSRDNSWTDGTDSSSDGTQEGTNEENTIHRALLVIRGPESSCLYAEVSRLASSSSSGSYTLSASMPIEKVLEFGKKAEGKSCEIFVIANHAYESTAELSGNNLALENYVSHVSSLSSSYLTVQGGLPMSNFKEASFTVSGWTPDNLANHLSDATAITLTESPIEIERSVARIDYRDRVREESEEIPAEPHTYKVGDSGYEVRIIEMCPVNVSKEFYTFRHILNEDNTPSFLGRETATNYILDTDNGVKANAGASVPAGHFLNQGVSGSNSYEGWETLFNGTETKYPYRPETSDNKGYTTWRYITENTIADKEQQYRGYTTAIAFKAEITKAPANAPEGNRQGDILLYYHFIKHNDNNDPATMGPMEFGIVRNNIYRLSIESINSLPRPYNPEDPDEPGETELTLKVRVFNWGYERIIFDM